MKPWKRLLFAGSEAAIRTALADAVGLPVLELGVTEPVDGDLVVVEAMADHGVLAALPGGHAFTACRTWKVKPGVAVALVLRSDDGFGPQIARFCLADAVLTFDASTGRLDCGAITGVAPRRRGKDVDGLLARMEHGFAAGQRGASALQRLLQFEQEDGLLQQLQDPETGLFNGPFAAWKLDEEWKRAQRFHLPLSLLLVDLGPLPANLSPSASRGLFAEVAGVFLNECRDIDVLARFSPQTFLVLLPGTGPDGAVVVARRVLAALQQRAPGGSALRPACGLAAVPHSGVTDRRQFLSLAESCLHRAQSGEGDGGLVLSWE